MLYQNLYKSFTYIVNKVYSPQGGVQGGLPLELKALKIYGFLKKFIGVVDQAPGTRFKKLYTLDKC